MEKAMSHHHPNAPSPSSWLTGLIVILAVIVSYMGFARVSVEWTLGIASVIFVGLIVFLWRAGVRKERNGDGGR
jgi:hypothetical protein